MLYEIDKLKQELNALLEEPYTDDDKILETSRKLDKLIVEYYQKMLDENDNNKSIWFYSNIII